MTTANEKLFYSGLDSYKFILDKIIWASIHMNMKMFIKNGMM